MGQNVSRLERAQMLRAESLALLEAVDDRTIFLGSSEKRRDIRAALLTSVDACDQVIARQSAEIDVSSSPTK